MFWEPVNFTVDDSVNGEVRLDFDETLHYFKIIIANAHIANSGRDRILLRPSWVSDCHSLAGITRDQATLPRQWGVDPPETGGFYLGHNDDDEFSNGNAHFSLEYTIANFGENTIGNGESTFALHNGHVIGFECVGRAANIVPPEPSIPPIPPVEEKWVKILYSVDATLQLEDEIVLLKGQLDSWTADR